MHMTPTLSQTLHHGWPKSTRPIASNAPWPGGYIDMYVGRIS